MKINVLLTLSSSTALSLPLFSTGVSAGFPSPADDFMEAPLDLNEHLIKHPSATFYARAQGESMIGLGIFDGDLLIVDRATPPQHGDVVIAAIDGELTCKILDVHNQMLRPGNAKYPPIKLHNDMEMTVEGVVIHSIRHHRCLP
jgi:DNA polymerase V